MFELIFFDHFDWDSFLINVLSGLIFFVFSIVVSVWLIPKYTFRLIRRKNQHHLVIKISSVIQELCDFIADSPFRDKSINSNHILITSSLSPYNKIVAICIINVFDKLMFYKLKLIIYDSYKKKTPDELYRFISSEHERFKILRIEIERILSAHSLYMDDEIILKISNLCFDIKSFETKFKTNLIYDELIEATSSNRNGVFGINELPMIYENTLTLIKDLISLGDFSYKFETNNN